MAWRSSGSTNDELVDNLKRFSIVSSPAVERGFRNVDRKYFVPKDQEPIAHADQPLKDGNVHLSAPHIYGSALEALELQENSALSFLNIGSGTGYMSCIVASILGQQSTNYGVEIHKDVVQHSLNAISEWKADADADADAEIPCIDMIHGNALNISMQEGEALIGFDRIYVGAAVDPSDLTKFTSLLKPGGVLVGPVGDELQKIVRIRNSVGEISSDDLSIQVISGVRFASLVSTPILKAVLPSRVWSPSVHQSYPSSFRRSSKELMLCSHSAYNQPLPKESKPKSYVNLAATLPRFVWMEILSYTHRNWFEPPQSNEDFLRHRLKEEEENCRKAHDARMEAEARCHMAERERDVYRLLARRLQARMQLLIQQNGESAIENANAAVDFDDDLMNVNVTGNLGVMLRGFESDSDDDSDSSDEEAMETEDTNQIQNQAIDEDDDNYVFFSDEDDVPAMEESGSSSSESGPNKPSSQISLSPKALVVRPQPRTVSISEET
mmetsp:Transcript_19877/g.29871  ORF Transcript_19877/g.29871 Transcript_19877/m.29871 type:complete len:497 (+) Transcript_19877:124-1614(+)